MPLSASPWKEGLARYLLGTKDIETDSLLENTNALRPLETVFDAVAHEGFGLRQE
jgi:hypothetical protein